MIKLYENGIYLVNGETICSCPEEVAQKSGRATTKEEATKGTRLTTRAMTPTPCA